MSRDDSGSFLPHYQELEITKNNPFATIDRAGVGKLMEMARDLGKKPGLTSSSAFVANMVANPRA
jgi:pyruvate, orthophosphate dikinase